MIIPNLMTAHTVIAQVQTMIDRVPFTGEAYDTASDVLDSPSGTVALEHLLRWLHAGQRDMAERYKGAYLGSLNQEYVGTFADWQTNEEEAMNRPLTVERQWNGTWYPCRNRSKGRHIMLRGGRQATNTAPVYTWDRRDLKIYPVDSSATVRIRYIKAPDEIGISEYNADNDSLQIDAKLEFLLVCFVAKLAQEHLQRYGLGALNGSILELLEQPFLRTTMIGVAVDYERSRRLRDYEQCVE